VLMLELWLTSDWLFFSPSIFISLFFTQTLILSFESILSSFLVFIILIINCFDLFYFESFFSIASLIFDTIQFFRIWPSLFWFFFYFILNAFFWLIFSQFDHWGLFYLSIWSLFSWLLIIFVFFWIIFFSIASLIFHSNYLFLIWSSLFWFLFYFILNSFFDFFQFYPPIFNLI
jgi:hypothetical protein